MPRLILPALIAAALWCASVFGSAAQGLPALYNVTGVASNDVLNVRQAPSGSAPIMGALAHNQTGVQVLRLNQSGTWGFVNTGEGSGWTSMRYLAAVPGGSLPSLARFACFGTEPFWSIAVTQGQSAKVSIMGVETQYGVSQLVPASGRRSPFALFGQGQSGGLTAMITPGTCSDGMSDNEFGYSVGLVLHGQTPQFYAGCCTLDSGNWFR